MVFITRIVMIKKILFLARSKKFRVLQYSLAIVARLPCSRTVKASSKTHMFLS